MVGFSVKAKWKSGWRCLKTEEQGEFQKGATPHCKCSTVQSPWVLRLLIDRIIGSAFRVYRLKGFPSGF